MSFPSPEADYRNFRLRKINTPEYKHLWYLLIWPFYLLRYYLIETMNPASVYHPIHSPLDDLIPFQECFVIFYVLWYVLFVGMHLYAALYDVDSFRKYSKFLIVSISISSLIFLIYPSCQNLRPESFPRDNVLTRLMNLIYAIDTNTNVFPSEHAIGALAIFAAAINTKSLRSPGKIAVFAVLTVMICLSTVFLKQHSILDVLGAIPICAFTYWICYRNPGRE